MNATALQVLIADDEPPARARIAHLLHRKDGHIVTVMADSGPGALAAIREHRLDMAFIDIHMPGMSGLDVVRALDRHSAPATIFVTAHERYAIEAFEVAAVDYLLKPFDNERFEQAMQRALQRRGLPPTVSVSSKSTPAPQFLQRIAVESRGQVRSVPVEQIDYVSASGVYAEIHVGDKVHIIRESMQALQERLDPQQFLRIHRSYIVRLCRIDVLLRQAGADYTVLLHGGNQLPVSRGRIDELENWMGMPKQRL